jgi:hypothetical protein
MIDWKIRSRSSKCQACEAPFADGQVYHTLLFAEKDENVRTDVCRDCWDGQYGQGASDRKGFISHWTGKFQVPPPPPPEPIQKETADSALRKLIELQNPEYNPICFILATMLERKRLLKVREEFASEGKRGFVYEQPKTGDIFTILDPELKLNELQEIQHDVALLLEEGVDAFLERRGEEEATEDGADETPTDSEDGEELGEAEVAVDEESEDTVPVSEASSEMVES